MHLFKQFSCPVQVFYLLRWHRPIGAWLLFLPGFWSIAYAGGVSYKTWFLYGLGAFWARSVGCVYNDYVDKKYDADCVRTLSRPFATGNICILSWCYIIFFIFFPGILFFHTLPWQAVLYGFLGVVGMCIYPWCKRYIRYPQIFLGYTYTMGVVMVPLIAGIPLMGAHILLYMAGILWTLEYDTVYAFQDYEDDQRLGLQSTAVVWGKEKGPMVILRLRTARYILLSIVANFSYIMVWWSWFSYKPYDVNNTLSCDAYFHRAKTEGIIVGLILWNSLHGFTSVTSFFPVA